MPLIHQEEFEQLKRGVLPATGDETPYFNILLGNCNDVSFFCDLFTSFEKIILDMDAAIDFLNIGSTSEDIDGDASEEFKGNFYEIAVLNDAFDDVSENFMPLLKEKISAGAHLQDIQQGEKAISYAEILFQQTVLRYWDRAQEENIRNDLKARLVLNVFQYNAAQQKTGKAVPPSELKKKNRPDNNN